MPGGSTWYGSTCHPAQPRKQQSSSSETVIHPTDSSTHSPPPAQHSTAQHSTAQSAQQSTPSKQIPRMMPASQPASQPTSQPGKYKQVESSPLRPPSPRGSGQRPETGGGMTDRERSLAAASSVRHFGVLPCFDDPIFHRGSERRAHIMSEPDGRGIYRNFSNCET
jgi:hypothetical protein